MSKEISTKDIAEAAATAATATLTNTTKTIIKGKMVTWSYSAAPTGGKCTLKSGSTSINEWDITAAGPGFMPIDGFNTVAGENLVAVLASGAGTVVGKVGLSASI